jgi:hypothetical protein
MVNTSSEIMVNNASKVDWSQLCYPGRKTPFTADELARAGSDAPSATLLAVAGVNAALLSFLVLQIAPPEQTARLTGLLVFVSVLAYKAGRWLWRNPWRRPLAQASLGTAFLLGLMLGGIHARMEDPQGRASAGMLLAVSGIGVPVLLWFLALWRAHQIESRLRELAEREKAVEMARRLAAAQVEPHFLFNTLASVQHWVETKDERAAPLLAALTGYLRATLPLFNRPLLAAADELLAVRRYLEVMQARLGARLAWQMAVPAEAERAELPPGLLLTLVENAIEHGVEPQLRGGEIVVSARREGERVVFSVQDNGPGPVPEGARGKGHGDGVGLAHARQCLALAFGAEAELRVGPAPGGGCLAEIDMPYKEAAA